MTMTATLTEERPFILCGKEYVRVDLIESFRIATDEAIAIRTASGLAYTFTGDKWAFYRSMGLVEQVATA